MTDKLPFSIEVAIAEYNPPHKLWHVPQTKSGVCPWCNAKISGGDSISAGGHDWHKECLRCSLCKKIIQPNQYVTQDDFIFHHDCCVYCFRDRCAKCTKLIDDDEYCSVFDLSYHKKCLVCERCGKVQENLSKIRNIYNVPYCQICYEELIKDFQVCLTCKNPILPDESFKTFFYQGKKYFLHDPECTKCYYCKRSNDSDFICYDKKPVCKRCYQSALLKICSECNELIFEQECKMENIYWHQDHFKCSLCGTPLKANTCQFAYNILKCRSCALEDRPVCPGCGKPIEEQPVQALKASWHQHCLKCQFCLRPATTGNFYGVSGKPCCKDCFDKKKKEGVIDPKTGQLKEKHHHHHHRRHSDY